MIYESSVTFIGEDPLLIHRVSEYINAFPGNHVIFCSYSELTEYKTIDETMDSLHSDD